MQIVVVVRVHQISATIARRKCSHMALWALALWARYYEAPIGSAGKPEHTGREKEHLKRAELRRRKKMKLEREEMLKIKFGSVQSNAWQ